MKPARLHRTVPASKQGAAIVLTIFSILLITILVVAFLMSMRTDRLGTASYSQMLRVQELAKGATEEILADLVMEMNAGSRADAEFTVEGTRIFVPTSALSSQPARIGFVPGTSGDYAPGISSDKIPPSLVRVSRAFAETELATLFPPASYDASKLPPRRASAVPSSTPSTNGRYISGKRWNKPLLMGETVPTRFSNKPPDWIYFTRSGSRSYSDADVVKLRPSSNLDLTEPVLGRYAYVIYDEGGLIDINCAGYPSTLGSDSGGPAAIRGKSGTLYAALTALPGLAGKNAELNDLVNWRSKGSITNAGGFLNAADEWMKSGFLEVKSGDSPVLSRQDLIDYFSKKFGETSAKQALPYLGTFSRYLSAPSTRPSTPVLSPAIAPGSEFDYADKANQPAGINRDLANARFSSTATVTHYADDASSKTYQVKKGDRLLQSRFSLARLAWLRNGNPSTGSGPAGAEADAIKACFGLVWDHPGGSSGSGKMANGGHKCWNYTGPAGSTASLPGTIKTLDEVAAEGREPDFFELLKAAILHGSLGKHPGRAGFNNGENVEGFNKDYYYPWGDDNLKKGAVGFYAYTFGPSSSVKVPARIPDMQIIRIGANIIDQYDEDSWPTAIYFKYQGVGVNDPVSGSMGNPVFGPVSMAYGTENLPYLQSVRQILASPSRSSTGNPGTGTDLGTNVFGGWRQPYLWNPHMRPAQNMVNRPTRYEIRCYGSPCMTQWSWPGSSATAAGKNYQTGLSNSVSYFETNNSSENSSVGTLTFTLADSASPSAFCFYDKPYPLLQNGLSNVTATSPEAGNLGTSAIAYYDENMPSPYGMPNHFVGFSTGVTPITDPGVGSSFRPFYVSNANGLTGQGRPELGTNTYVLGWVDSANGFHPYSFLTGVFTFEGTKLEQAEKRVGTANPDRGTETWTLVDPRTERFSLARGLQAGFLETISVYRGNNSGWFPGGRPRAEEGFFGQGYPWQVYSFPHGDLMVNSPTDPPTANPPISPKINYVAGNTQSGYYSDPDGVVRPGDGYFGNPSTGDGLMLFITAANPSGSPVLNSDKTVDQNARRPVILNRPFRSVGELGYVFRDQPFKTLDFFSDKSADTALLDVFCLNDLAEVGTESLLPLGAGRVNLNAAPASVIAALIQGGTKKEMDATYNLGSESTAIATTVANRVLGGSSYDPFKGYGDLAPVLITGIRTAATSSADKSNKAYLEAPMRALSESTDFRTWNLLIDLVAQSGRISPGAKTLGDFTVQAEYHVWVHVAIDRYTGKVIARQWEPVYE